MGYNENGLLHHLSKKQRCYYLSEQNDVSTGLLPDTSSSYNLKNGKRFIEIMQLKHPFCEEVNNKEQIEAFEAQKIY